MNSNNHSYLKHSSFANRHLGPDEKETKQMLEALDCKNLNDLTDQAIPSEVLNVSKLNLPAPVTETDLIKELRKKAGKNKVFKNYIGQGFFECLPLAVTNRNIIKNPVWYTAYTPYQAELAQGRLEALLNFQTMICDLTGMEIANASLLDESSACAEAVAMAVNISDKKTCLFVDHNMWEQNLAVTQTRADSIGIKIQKGSLLKDNISDDTFAVLFQYPFADGSLDDVQAVIQNLKKRNILVLICSDLLANCLIKPPGELGADIAVGSTGRLGLPLFYGGPHSAFLATKKDFSRSIPGRIVGVSKDKYNKKAFRLTLQTREQHIRRERATSNICTAQALPAILTSFYAVYHGKEGLKSIAQSIHDCVCYLYSHLKKLNIVNHTFFDTLTIQLTPHQKAKLQKLCIMKNINLGYSKYSFVNISVGEGRTKEDMDELIEIFKELMADAPQTAEKKNSLNPNINTPSSKKSIFSHNLSDILSSGMDWLKNKNCGIPNNLIRNSSFLDHPVFNEHQSETKLIRYIHYLQNKDMTLAHSMIPLGSCTMKLNATTQLQPMTWKGFSDIHPFCPQDQVEGSLEIFKELEKFLCELTGFSAFSLQPNAGSQGEYAGLLIFKKYHESIGQRQRNICLIPSSAHGTNPASAQMAGLKVVTVPCEKSGGIDQNQLEQMVQKHSKSLSCLMLTYPSTCGVFEKNIPKICSLINQHGGLVYFDGANMNALTGLCQPAQMGFSAGHLNLHKTFCIPHGGGGPGSGPIGVTEKLKKFLPSHPFLGHDSFCIGSTPFGNAGVLSVPWAYIRLMGISGLKKASQTAILNANYIKKRLKPFYKILFTGDGGHTAHECIIDLRKFKYSAGIDVVDVAKRLMDYGFHSPTMSWPIPGTLMIEPTESEDKKELDRFCSALIEIRKEITQIEEKKADPKNNLLKNAPHTIYDLSLEKWPFAYSKKKACFPLPYLEEKKFWPPVGRIDEAYGDIHLFCSCPPVEKG